MTLDQDDINAIRDVVVSALGGTGFDVAEHGLKPISDKVDALEPATLTGPHTLTVTVTDDADDPIEGASARVHRTGHSETKLTDADGEVTFTVEAATWTVSVTASGYNGESESVVVDGDAAVTVALTLTTTEPLDAADVCRCTLGVLSLHNVPISGAVMAIETRSKLTFVADQLVLPVQTKPVSSGGVFTVDLAKSTKYRATVTYQGSALSFEFETPDASSANMGAIRL